MVSRMVRTDTLDIPGPVWPLYIHPCAYILAHISLRIYPCAYILAHISLHIYPCAYILATLPAGLLPELLELPWWAYGPAGMQLWFPSLLLPALHCLSKDTRKDVPNSNGGDGAAVIASGLAASGSLTPRAGALPPGSSCAQYAASTQLPIVPPGGGTTEVELEFDAEVTPIGVSLADASIVGIRQRVLRAPASLSDRSGVRCWLPGLAFGV
jgi:hypothetical protein